MVTANCPVILSMANRYDTSQNPEAQFQPDSNNQVLFNILGIIDPQEMENIELNLLDQLTTVVIENVTENQTITLSNLCEWHRRWLGNVATNLSRDSYQKQRVMNNTLSSLSRERKFAHLSN